jgi:hypothetical protein
MMWSKKDWYVKNRLIGPNGVEKIRQGLDQLLLIIEYVVVSSLPL